MDLSRLTKHALEFQAIPAPTFEESERAGLVLDAFRAAGLEQAEFDRLGNVLARVPGGSRPPVVLSAHLDSVFAREGYRPARRVGDRLVGPGIGDNAIGLSALVEIPHHLTGDSLPGDLWLVADVCEEGHGNLRGMRQIVERFGSNVSAYIVLEGMALGHVYHGALPVLRYRVEARTQGGHSWIHAGRPSAIGALIEIGAELGSLRLPEKPRTTLNIGTIRGGTSVNSIASEASLDLDLRSESVESLLQLGERVERTVRSHGSREVRIEIERTGERPSGSLATDHPLVRAALTAFQEVGVRCVLETGSTAASIPLSLGLPAVCVGLTQGGNAHTREEYVEIQPLRQGFQALLRLIAGAYHLPDP